MDMAKHRTDLSGSCRASRAGWKRLAVYPLIHQKRGFAECEHGTRRGVDRRDGGNTGARHQGGDTLGIFKEGDGARVSYECGIELFDGIGATRGVEAPHVVE
jgi:hypothetical protein